MRDLHLSPLGSPDYDIGASVLVRNLLPGAEQEVHFDVELMHRHPKGRVLELDQGHLVYDSADSKPAPSAEQGSPRPASGTSPVLGGEPELAQQPDLGREPEPAQAQDGGN